MKSEVVYICFLFAGETGIQLPTACEVLLFECSSSEEVAVVIPYHENETIILKKGNIKYFLYDAETRLIKFILKKPLKNMDVPHWEVCDAVTIELLPKSDSVSNKVKGEFCIFRDFSNKHFHGVESKQMVNTDYFDGDFYTHNMLVYRKLFEAQGFLQYTSFCDKRFKAQLRAYVYFLNHRQLNEKKFKKFMRSQENLPNFLKNVLGFDDHNAFFFNLSEVLRSHICSCYKTTHKKCSACRLAPSCSMECHIKNWDEHKGFCKEEVDDRKSFEKQRQTLLGHLMSQLSPAAATVLVSFEVFQQELMDAIFVTCCPIIEGSNLLDKWIQDYFHDIPKSKWVVEMLSLKKKQYEKMYRNLDSGKATLQITSTWGKVLMINVDSYQ